MPLGPLPLSTMLGSQPRPAKRKEHPVAPSRKPKASHNDDVLAKSSDAQKGKSGKAHRPQAELKQQQLSFISNPTKSTSQSPGPCTPSVATRREQNALQTPPATVEARSRAKHIFSAKQSSSGTPPNGDSAIATTSHLPTPTTRLRPQRSQIHAAAASRSMDTPSKIVVPEPSFCKRPLLLSRGSSPEIPRQDPLMVVPSSQSQQEMTELPLDRSDQWSVTDDLEEPEETETEPEDFESTMLPEYHRDERPGLVVASSQSQFLVSNELSPRKKRRRLDGPSLHISTRQPEVHEVVPSSQSCEEELEIPKAPEGEHLARKATPRRLRSTGWGFVPGYPPARTLSDEMFDVPISSGALDHLLDYDNHQHVHPGPSSSSAPSKDEPDCVAEFDSDEAASHVHPIHEPVDTSSPENEEQEAYYGPTQDDSLAVSYPPAVLSRKSSEDHPADDSQSADDSPSLSLPSVLQEFRDMFGDGDESYPPDFPMSLRL